MVEPTETESKEVLDHAIEVFRKLYNDALENPESSASGTGDNTGHKNG